MNSLDPFFRPRSVALVGAAHTEEKLGGVVLKNLLKFGGTLYPVNPKYGELMGRTCYPAVADIPAPVDLGIILRPSSEVPAILREFEGRARCVLIMSSGFAEVGETGLQAEVQRLGREMGIRIVGPNCMGVYNPHARLDTFFLPSSRLPRPKKGNVAVISQSGAILSCLLSAVKDSNTGISKAVGYGNAVDVTESDLYGYLANDGKTEVVVSYLESVADGRRFLSAAKQLAERKSLVILKAGKGSSGQAAAFSHTGRLAGRYEVFHSLVGQFGIREVTDFDELVDAAKALSYRRPSVGKRVCIITNGGGSGVLAADECMRQDLEVTALSSRRKARLTEIFPDFYGINNPVDLTAQVRDEDYALALRELKDDYDGFVVIALPNVLGITERLPEVLTDVETEMHKPVVAHIASSGITAKLRVRLERARIPVYPSPERAVRGLRVLLGQGTESGPR
jgi:acetate---CoA ligase (ADP-forming) subunit alpha